MKKRVTIFLVETCRLWFNKYIFGLHYDRPPEQARSTPRLYVIQSDKLANRLHNNPPPYKLIKMIGEKDIIRVIVCLANHDVTTLIDN